MSLGRKRKADNDEESLQTDTNDEQQSSTTKRACNLTQLFENLINKSYDIRIPAYDDINISVYYSFNAEITKLYQAYKAVASGDVETIKSRLRIMNHMLKFLAANPDLISRTQQHQESKRDGILQNNFFLKPASAIIAERVNALQSLRELSVHLNEELADPVEVRTNAMVLK